MHDPGTRSCSIAKPGLRGWTGCHWASASHLSSTGQAASSQHKRLEKLWAATAKAWGKGKSDPRCKQSRPRFGARLHSQEASPTGSHKVGLSMPRLCLGFSDSLKDPEVGVSETASEWQRGKGEMLCGVVSGSVGRLGGSRGAYVFVLGRGGFLTYRHGKRSKKQVLGKLSLDGSVVGTFPSVPQCHWNR